MLGQKATTDDSAPDSPAGSDAGEATPRPSAGSAKLHSAHPPSSRSTVHTDPRSLRLRVFSWNIHKGIGGLDRRYDLGRIIAVIQSYDADILLLQEVTQLMPRLRSDDQVTLLSQALERHAAYHAEHRFRVGSYGNLILSKWPLKDIRHLDLTIGQRKKRGLVQAQTRLRFRDHQRTIVIHNLHLGLAGSERARQLERFVNAQPFKRWHHATPLIVGGDLNDLWGSLGPRFLEPHGLTRAGRLTNTFPSAMPLRPLDGIFYRGDLELVHAQVCGCKLSRIASDHRPILADFRLT